MKKLHFISTDVDGEYYAEIYQDEDGNRYDFVYEFKHIETKDADGNWVVFDGEYEID